MQTTTDRRRIDIRAATTDDEAAIRRIASRSFAESYGDVLDQQVVDRTVAAWYGRDPLADRLDADDTVFLLLTVGTEPAGFSDCTHEPDALVGSIDWLHVDPFHRGAGLGEMLLRETEQRLVARGAERVAGRVLESNAAGNEFYRAQGYTQAGSRTIDIDDETHTENRYLVDPTGDGGERILEPVETDGRTLYLALDERERGTEAPFFVAYSSPDPADRYGFYCDNCGTVRTSMDTMGRITCTACGNERRPSRWDAAYL